jgi:hypothetical protein
MTFEYDAPDTLESGNFLRTPGSYHLQVLDVEEQPTNSRGELMNGFRVNASVLHGTACTPDGQCTEKGKTVDIMFFNGKLTDKDQGKFARQKQGKFFTAIGLFSTENCGKKVQIDLQAAIGRQFVAALELDSRDERYLQLRYADIHHVDDPAVKGIPKDEAALAVLPKELRLIGAQPKEANGDNDKPQSAAAEPKRKTVDLDNL